MHRLLLIVVVAAGCQPPATAPVSTSQQATPHAATAAPVRVIKPERKTVRHPIDQPGFNIEAFQETALFARIPGYVEKWNADIGDRVRKGQILASLYVPEMEVDLKQKEATVRQSSAQIQQARALLLTAQAQLERSKSQFERFQRLGQAVIDKENVDEIRLGYETTKAGVEKARADVTAAEAQLEVAQAARDYSKTMLQYRELVAPYDSVVTQRNVNTGDLVQPAGSASKAQPLFVVQQLDPVRVFINVPGASAGWVQDGDPVSLRVQGAGGKVYAGKVTRTARSLNPQARTLRTEVDLPNAQGHLLPGMYVQAAITIEHHNVWTLPSSAIVTEGDQVCCYRIVAGKAMRTPLQVGLGGGGLIEVLKKQAKPASPGADASWEDVTGDEEIAANAAGLNDSQPVQQTGPRS
jgi:HlyD family secretion protein